MSSAKHYKCSSPDKHDKTKDIFYVGLCSDQMSFFIFLMWGKKFSFKLFNIILKC